MNKIDFKQLKKVIPDENYNTSQKDLRNKYTEWCVSVYNVNDKKYVTISIKKVNAEKSIYFNQLGDRILYDMNSDYDKYLIKKFFWYASDS